MAKLSKNNKYAISWLHTEGYSEEKISEELGVPLVQVTKHIKTMEPIKTKTEAEEYQSKKTSKDFMITQTSEKGTRNVAIMTKAASEMNDKSKSKSQLNSNPSMDRPGIFRPNK